MAPALDRVEYRRQRKMLATVMIGFGVMFAMVLPGRNGELATAMLIALGFCLAAAGVQLAALVMNGPDA